MAGLGDTEINDINSRANWTDGDSSHATYFRGRDCQIKGQKSVESFRLLRKQNY